jgi:hypothetical protein
MKDDLDKSRELMKVQSELNAQREAAILMDKIDKLTGKFLDSNKQVRQSTVLAAMADAATEGTGKVLGSWGSLGGVDVRTSGKSLLGQEDEQASLAAPRKNRILIIADETKVCHAYMNFNVDFALSLNHSTITDCRIQWPRM